MQRSESEAQECGHSILNRMPNGKCRQCARLEAATSELEAQCARIHAGDLDSVELWANDPVVCHGELSKAALLSLCRQLRAARQENAKLLAALYHLMANDYVPGAGEDAYVSHCKAWEKARAAISRAEGHDAA